MNEVLTPLAKIKFDESDRILHMKMLEGAEMTLKNAQIHYEKINTLVGNKKYLALVDSSNYYSIEKEAWEYASLKEVFSNRIAVAHYNSFTPNRLLINFYKNRYDPVMPLKIFKTETEARAWLKTIPIDQDQTG